MLTVIVFLTTYVYNNYFVSKYELKIAMGSGAGTTFKLGGGGSTNICQCRS